MPEAEHRFTCREVVYSVYIAAELGKRILELSETARQAADADNWYAIGGRWGSGERLYFYGPDGRGFRKETDEKRIEI